MGDTLDEKEWENAGNKPNYYSKRQSNNSTILLLIKEPTEPCSSRGNQLCFINSSYILVWICFSVHTDISPLLFKLLTGYPNYLFVTELTFLKM